MKKKVALITCMLFLMSLTPIIQGSYCAEPSEDYSNIGIYVDKGDVLGDFIKKYMGFDLEIINSGDDLLPIDVSIVLNSYELNGNLNWTYSYNKTHYLGWDGESDVGFHMHFSFGEHNLKTSFITMVVTANEKSLTTVGLRIGDYFLFLRGFKTPFQE